MALYLGNSNKLNINLNGVIYRLNLFSATSITDYVRLLSSDNYILKDSSGIYLIPSDYMSPVVDRVLLSLDGHILKDSSGIYLIPSDYMSPVVDRVLLSLDGHILKDSSGIYLTY